MLRRFEIIKGFHKQLCWQREYSMIKTLRQNSMNIHGTPVREVSYRMTSNRYDSEKWPTHYEGEEEGMEVELRGKKLRKKKDL